ncbi:adenylyl-sulfate kinase [Hungatella hathewayi]|uniref:adenylyl-sulfate kinase n=1 Tax=Hungatella hathewayi TaxID=154046 RepID=UPI0035660114
MGRVFWITGLAGAGKTTIGQCLYKKIKSRKSNILYLDGDQIREVFGNDLGYTREERFKGAMRNARLCELIAGQGIDVVCCTIAMFDEIRRWNRQNIPCYVEIYVKVSMEVLKKRDQKGLYSGIKEGTTEDVVGMDLELDLPQNPDIILNNDGCESPESLAEQILSAISYEF